MMPPASSPLGPMPLVSVTIANTALPSCMTTSTEVSSVPGILSSILSIMMPGCELKVVCLASGRATKSRTAASILR